MFRKAGGIALQQLLIERGFQFGVSRAEYQRRGSLFPQFFLPHRVEGIQRFPQQLFIAEQDTFFGNL